MDETTYRNVLSEKGKKELIYDKYSCENKNTECPILHKKFNIGDEIIKLPCGHCYDPEAIIRWLTLENASCPICREPLNNSELRKI